MILTSLPTRRRLPVLPPACLGCRFFRPRFERLDPAGTDLPGERALEGESASGSSKGSRERVPNKISEL
eukprot:767897-Hanusia_phi.AAC.2